MPNEPTGGRLKKLVEAETKAWDSTIEALGGKGRVPIRYLINLPGKPEKK